MKTRNAYERQVSSPLRASSNSTVRPVRYDHADANCSPGFYCRWGQRLPTTGADKGFLEREGGRGWGSAVRCRPIQPEGRGCAVRCRPVGMGGGGGGRGGPSTEHRRHCTSLNRRGAKRPPPPPQAAPPLAKGACPNYIWKN